LLAVTMLDVRVPPLAVRQLLCGEANEISLLLADVPASVPLWRATDAVLSNASKVWELLRNHRGIDWVTAGKLLARKRPMLIPVYDSVIKGALRPSGSFWKG
jgi:Family of unknown function (DUF6308)